MSRQRLLLILLLLLVLPALLSLRLSIPVEELIPEYAGPQARWMDYEGTRVHYRLEGRGPDLVLIHGTLASLHTWDGWVEELKPRFRILRMDLGAFGLTGPFANRDYSAEAYVRQVRALTARVGMERFHLAGNSLGGLVAWTYALRHPDQVDRLVLVNAAGYVPADTTPMVLALGRNPLLRSLVPWFTPEWGTRLMVRSVYGDPSRIPPATFRRYQQLFLREGNRQAYVDYARSLDIDLLSHRIGEIRHPVLILWGEKDHVLPVASARRFHQELTDSRLIIYPELGHIPMEEAPQRTAEDVRRFLQNQSRAP